MRSRIAVLTLAFAGVCRAQMFASQLPNSCGQDNVKFTVKVQKDHPAVPAADTDKAQLILIESENQMYAPFHYATVRYGLDGKWVGADEGNSYFVLPVAPGLHHVCANWQSGFEALHKNVDLTSFSAEAGHTYYFEVHIEVESRYAAGFKLSQINEDKGRYLTGVSGVSASKRK